jgi:hypothetical protein
MVPTVGRCEVRTAEALQDEAESAEVALTHDGDAAADQQGDADLR